MAVHGATEARAPGQPEPVHLPQPAAGAHRLTLWALAAAAGIGAFGALCAAAVRLGFRGLEWVLTRSDAAPPVAAAHLPLPRRCLSPLVGAVLAMLVLWVHRRFLAHCPHDEDDYVDYVKAVRHGGGVIPLRPNCWRTASAAFSVASGAAVGREGSMIQFAAMGASTVGHGLNARLGKKAMSLAMLVACGVAGGVTAAYNAPVAAIFFVAEIVLGAFRWRELVLLAIASAAGWGVSGAILGFARLYPAPVGMLEQGWRLALLPLAAILFGLLGPGYQALIAVLHRGRRLPGPLAWSGLLVGVLSLLDPRVWGNGDLGLSAALGRAELPGLAIGVPALALLLALRLLATDFCVGTGTVGGVFTPTLFAGGAAGALLGHLVGSPHPVLWALAGMSLLMAAVTHAPVMAACMAVELTGNWPLLVPLLLANLLAWAVARRLSPHALYSIATQAPAQPAPPEPDRRPAGYNRG